MAVVSAGLISIDEARAQVLDRAGGRLGEESVEIDLALDRVLAADVRAAGDVPPFAASAMDGYALGPGPTPGGFALVGESRAGHPHMTPLAEGEAIRISTGAAVPQGAVAVLRQEDATAGETRVEARMGVPPGANIRGPGEDMRRGAVVVTSGTRLRAAELGAAVAAGAARLTVARRPVVAVACTGDELKPPGEPLRLGEIHNSNGPMLRALAIHAGALAGPADTLPDDPAATEDALSAALEGADMVLISGGVSVGPHDHVKPALERLGVTQHFWGVALQPGKPTWFGSRGEKLVFALPGNPVSTAVTFSLFARPALDALLGAAPERAPADQARLDADARRSPGRDQAIRVRLRSVDGELRATSTGAQDSHLYTSLLAADALAIIPRGEGVLPAGSAVRLEPPPR
jgi:molybdopterin molybdotransferase